MQRKKRSEIARTRHWRRQGQISDGQIQAATSATIVSGTSDGQIQAATSAVIVSQISDGQIQTPPSEPAVTQISDGQIQRSPSEPAVTQISDGQIQRPPSEPAVTQISDGQIQSPTSTPSPSPKRPPGTTSDTLSAAETAGKANETPLLESRPSDELAAGEKAGIGVSAAVVFIALIAALIWVFRRYTITKKPTREKLMNVKEKRAFFSGKRNMFGRAELDADREIREVEDTGRPYEKDGNARSELHGDEDFKA